MSHLTLVQRYIIDVVSKGKYLQPEIAERIGRDKSPVCLELQGNSDKRSGACKADLAERKYLKRHRVKAKEIYFTEAVKSHLTIESFKGYG